jgi:hypothetical protein
MYGAFQDHELEKLTLVDIFFLAAYFLFLILSFDIIFFIKKLALWFFSISFLSGYLHFMALTTGFAS